MSGGQGVIDFSSSLDYEWYNFFEGAPASIFAPGANRSAYRGHPASAATLNGYQMFGESLKCAIKVLADGQVLTIPHNKDAKLGFHITGGADMPRFELDLTLVCPGPQKEPFVFKAIWTAWGETLFDSNRTVHIPSESPSYGDTFTFSSRLERVKVTPKILTADQAEACDPKEGADGLVIEWTQQCSPYCFRFRVPESALAAFTQSQRAVLDTFRKLAQPNAGVRVLANRTGCFPQFWRFMTAMPVPTVPPFPLYDCRYDTVHQLLKPIAEIPPVDEHFVKARHARRVKGWVNQPPGFAPKFEILSINSTVPIRFINEREYEVVKTVGLLREAEFQKETMQRGFDHVYMMKLVPASTIHGSRDKRFDTCFYALLDVTPREGSFLFGLEQNSPIPETGTPVIISVKQGFRASSHPTQNSQPSEVDWRGQVVATPK